MAARLARSAPCGSSLTLGDDVQGRWASQLLVDGGRFVQVGFVTLAIFEMPFPEVEEQEAGHEQGGDVAHAIADDGNAKVDPGLAEFGDLLQNGRERHHDQEVEKSTHDDLKALAAHELG